MTAHSDTLEFEKAGGPMTQDNVVIVGGGPVGLITALGLARAGIEVTVVEREPRIVASPRAMVYHWCVLDGLEDVGILDDAKKTGSTGGELLFRVFATGESIRMRQQVLDGAVPHSRNLHLGQDKLAAIALEHLRRHARASVVWNTKVTGLEQDENGVTVRAESPDGPSGLRAGWVIGTDGARSTVREALGLKFEGTTWPERFVATNVRYDFASLGFADASMLIDPSYGAIVARIDDTGLWRCTFCEDDSLPEETIPDRITEYFKATLPKGEADRVEVVQYSPYRMHQRAAERFRVGRVLLAGDAAHATNPTGGMGLTSGLFDSFVLYEALAAVIGGQVGEEILDRYSQVRREAFLNVASPMATQFKQLVFHSSDSEKLEGFMAGLRVAAGNEDMVREQFLSIAAARTPSLLHDDGE
ncbi:FAD-dependent oxidoreductase [Streptomyces sp. NPDC002143]